MAIAKDTTSLLSAFSGRIGNVVIKKYRDKIVLTSLPDMSRRKPSAKQKEYQALMGKANVYARQIIHNGPLSALAGRLFNVEPGRLYRALVKDFIAKKGDKRLLIIRLPAGIADIREEEAMAMMGHA